MSETTERYALTVHDSSTTPHHLLRFLEAGLCKVLCSIDADGTVTVADDMEYDDAQRIIRHLASLLAEQSKPLPGVVNDHCVHCGSDLHETREQVTERKRYAERALQEQYLEQNKSAQSQPARPW